MTEETKEEYFVRMLNWEEHFDTLGEFVMTLNEPSNASGSLGRISAKTIVRFRLRMIRVAAELAKELHSDECTPEQDKRLYKLISELKND